ncbi:MAG: response regulator transcription factor [Actinobacteria bacterium]|nr:response regulator transcription factor [Actinomycetota bacterium]
MKIKVLVADDHAVVRRGLKEILADESDFSLIEEASDAAEVFEKIQEQDFDVIVLDLTMPGRSGFELLIELKHKYPSLPVLILSIHPEDQFALRLLKAGASGYMNKESAPDELLKAIRKVVGGGKYVSSALAEKLAFDLGAGSGKAPHESLSDREYQVLCMIASGKTPKIIAQELYLSLKTISTYRSRILQKMKMQSNAELTHYAIKNRLVD